MNLHQRIMKMSDEELDAMAALHEIAVPLEFVTAGDEREAKAEWLAEKLGAENKDDFRDRPRPEGLGEGAQRLPGAVGRSSEAIVILPRNL